MPSNYPWRLYYTHRESKHTCQGIAYMGLGSSEGQKLECLTGTANNVLQVLMKN